MARPEKFTAYAVDLSNTAPRRNTTPVDITITQDEDGTIELENLSSEPVMLNDVRPVK